MFVNVSTNWSELSRNFSLMEGKVFDIKQHELVWNFSKPLDHIVTAVPLVDLEAHSKIFIDYL